MKVIYLILFSKWQNFHPQNCSETVAGELENLTPRARRSHKGGLCKLPVCTYQGSTPTTRIVREGDPSKKLGVCV